MHAACKRRLRANVGSAAAAAWDISESNSDGGPARRVRIAEPPIHQRIRVYDDVSRTEARSAGRLTFKSWEWRRTILYFRRRRVVR